MKIKQLFDDGEEITIHSYLEKCGIEDVDSYEENLDKLLTEIKERIVDYGFYISDFCKEYNCKQIANLLEFVEGLLSNTDEFEWISYLRNNTSDWSDFEDCYESSLWKAGKRISQEYFVCMYALRVCGEKLKEKINGEK